MTRTSPPAHLFAPMGTPRYRRAFDELDAYVCAHAADLRRAEHYTARRQPLNLWEFAAEQLDAAAKPAEDWHRAASALERALDLIREGMADQWPPDPRAIVSHIHTALSGGLVSPPKRSRFAQWYSHAAQVVCSCGRSTWGWTAMSGRRPPPGELYYLWWRVQCIRCGLACVLLLPQDEIDRAELDASHRATVAAYVLTSPAILCGDRDGFLVTEEAGAVQGLPYLEG